MFVTRLWPVLVLVAVCNVAMNVCLKRAATGPSGRTSALLGALGAGIASIALLLFIYRAGMPLSRAMLFLAATSLLLGIAAGVLLWGDRLHPAEIGLLVLLIAFYGASWRVRV